MKTVYVSLVCDSLHNGHMRVLKKAGELGKVVVGLMTDNGMLGRRPLPILDYEQRLEIAEGLSSVSEIIPQDTWSYLDNLERIRPQYVVHGSDWIDDDPHTRSEVIDYLSKNGGELIEIPYTPDVLDNQLFEREKKSNSFMRSSTLRRLLSVKKHLVFVEAHSPLSALIVEKSRIERPDGSVKEFDGFWSSSLTDSTLKGKPDIEALDITTRAGGIDDIFEVTQKPLIIDFDTGGQIEHFEFTVKTLERLGVSAVIIEDKAGLKKNSLFGNDVEQHQDSIENFSAKLAAGVKCRTSKDFMIIARIESLILSNGMNDAMARARAYVGAGADGIMIHSRLKDPDEIFEFIDLFRSEFKEIPIVLVPTSYNKTHETELFDRGANIVIHANQLLRAAYPAMVEVANMILEDGCSARADSKLMSVKEILELIPGTK